MPPPIYPNKLSGRSAGDHEPYIENECNSSTSENSSSEDDSKPKNKKKGVGIVKSLLGPSLEDAVLRTLEFGKYLIQKPDENETPHREKKEKRDLKKEIKEKSDNCFWEREGREYQNYPEGRSTRKRIVFTAKLDKDIPPYNPNRGGKKPKSVSKIRSLDSDLKHGVTSPESIKKQLEALIQINKDEPPEVAGGWTNLQRSIKPIEVTVMPSLCVYRNEADVSGSGPCDARSVRKSSEPEQCSTSRMRSSSERASRRRLGAASGICQAPEFLSNALGPTLDVSIIDNIKMMKDIFKGDSGKGEGSPKPIADGLVKQEEKIQMKTPPNQSAEIEYKIAELQRRVIELEQKEKCLLKQIEEEEKERECKRKAFEEEERKLCDMKSCLESLAEEEKKRECSKKNQNKSGTDCRDIEAKYECLKQRIACEEEKLSRLKDQYECYKREIMEVKSRKEALKRNKSLLVAWDVIASRVCHTRLPSFSRACNLERKQLKSGEDPADIHCCFLTQESQCTPSCGRKSRSRSQCGNRCENRSSSGCTRGPPACGSTSREYHPSWQCPTPKQQEIPFPIQRDIICGMHQMLKSCSCGEGAKNEGPTCSSDDELLKKSAMANREKMKGDCTYCGGFGATTDKIFGKPPIGKPVCRSRSEAALKKEKCAKIVKVMWAVTRINIFQDNCRTYEVMDATSTPPPCIPAKTEGIFVVKNPQKKTCATTPIKKKPSCNPPGV